MTRDFSARHIGIGEHAQAAMVRELGIEVPDGDSPLDAFVAQAVPNGIRSPQPPIENLQHGMAEDATLGQLRSYAHQNRVREPLIGLGYYGTFTPAVIQRNVLENPSWYTAYTPYQPEISQGRLEALINFQTMVTDLTGLDTANSSMLDESTAVAEAMLLARRASKSKSSVFVVDSDAFPQTKAVLATRAEPLGIVLVEVDLAGGATVPECFGVLVQYPGASGLVWNPSEVIGAAHEHGALAIVAADLLAMTLLTPPGELGADIAAGTTQRFGVPLGFGGPHAGYLAVKSGLERQLPGRLVGVSKDTEGYPAYRLALQTREQHIRREKATSNICTAQVLLAVIASMYAVYHGPEGLRRIAREVAGKARALADWLREGGVEVVHDSFFDTVRVRVPGRALAIADQLRAALMLVLVVNDDEIQVSVDETTRPARLADIARACAAAPKAQDELHSFEDAPLEIDDSLKRTSDFLTHPVFSSYHSETAMMRYLKRLADKDYALDRGMIPLGSCTMKLNAATEMAAITWPEFANLHPFAPAEDAAGTLELISDLESWLASLTGYDAVSLQPNAGSQGELAGLLAIRGYHRANGDTERDVCLIPASAHGTNAASAVLAGMRVVVVACDDAGNVDLDDLRHKIAANAETLSALMITYPSTHGVYELDVREICDAVHAAGGQVYIDGANFNALVGLSRLGELGGDVSHLNLHKTFAIPHGGGGPGIGPVAAKAHLAKFLPGHPLEQRAEHFGGYSFEGGPVSAAPYGSAGVLPISWAYIRLMGVEGLTQATKAAVLSANYIAAKLKAHYPVLYAAENGTVAHECILDLRPLKEATGISVDDVAKRLMDYGFHAPTMSFPVAGTLMVEPTESEDLVELDRFVEAMISIKAEADAAAGTTDNVLVNAPHTAASVISDAWDHPYPREQAAYPVAGLRGNKYWVPVRRIDNAWGDRNLACACPPPEAFES